MKNLVNPKEVLKNSPIEYCVMKKPVNFPDYIPGSDLDILCSNKKEMMQYLDDFFKENKDVDIKITDINHHKYIHFDVYKKGDDKLNFRFDLVDCLNKCYNVKAVSTEFNEYVLKNKYHDNDVFVPSIPCEMVIRMLEYMEHISHRPDKIKHLQFVEKILKSNEEYRNKFIVVWNKYIV